MTTVVVRSGAETGADEIGATEVGAMHLVQMVDVEVSVTVETVVPTDVVSEPPAEPVDVTGQVVTVTYVTTVVLSTAGAEEPCPDAAGAVDTAGLVGTGLEWDEVDSTGELPDGTLIDVVTIGLLVWCPADVLTDVLAAGEAPEVLVTGHTVVETAIVDVTTVTEFAGQFVTVGAQLVIVTSFVE